MNTIGALNELGPNVTDLDDIKCNIFTIGLQLIEHT